MSALALRSHWWHENQNQNKKIAQLDTQLFIDSGKIVHCGMAATKGTSLFSAALKYKHGQNVSIGIVNKLMELRLHFEIEIAEF